MNTWIDVHTHLNMIEKDTDLVIEEAKKKNVKKLISISTNPEDMKEVLSYVQKYPSYVYGTLGIHPHEASLYSNEVESFLKKHLSDKGIVGVGEIGLDFYYENSDKKSQYEAFEKQLQLAKNFKLPVEIHSRSAEDETISVLSQFKEVKGLIHCFSGSKDFAFKALDLGYNISLSGILTFKNADSLRKVIKELPIDRIHVETDAPYLTPHPFRGKKNEPCFIELTAVKIAEIKNIALEKLSLQLEENTYRLFEKLKEV